MPRQSKLTGLTPGQRAFIDAFLLSRNAVQSYRATFPATSYRAAAVQAHRLLKKPNIVAEIAAARRAQQRRTRIAADKVLRELARIASSDIIDLFDADECLRPVRRIPIETRRTISNVKVTRERTTTRVTHNGKTKTTVTVQESVIEYKFANKLDALGKLANYLGLTVSIPPIEVLLLALPPTLAGPVRNALATKLKQRQDAGLCRQYDEP